MSDHALSIKVMRLQAPDLHLHQDVTLNLANDLGVQLLDKDLQHPFAHRVHPQKEGLSPLMVLPLAFGTLYLG